MFDNIKINLIFIRKLFLFHFDFFLFINISFAQKINKFSISGNERVTNETIIMFSNLEIGQEVNNKILNNALKDLYYTNYFKI